MEETSIRFFYKDGMIYTDVNIPDGKEEEIVKIFNNVTNGALVPYITAGIEKKFTETGRSDKFEDLYSLLREVYATNLIRLTMAGMQLGQTDTQDDDEPVIDPELVFGGSQGVQDAT